jgi:RNA polymerase sigma factor (sigma-70 family)
LRRDPLENPEPLMRRVYAYVAYRIGEGAEAQDVTSDVFERALRYRDSYDPTRGEPVAWLIGIARHCINDALRGRQMLTPDPPELADPTELAEDAVRRIALMRELERLEPTDRELLALRYGADLTARQIGELLGMRKNAVDVALHRALARMRRLLEAQGERGAANPPPGVRDEPV